MDFADFAFVAIDAPYGGWHTGENIYLIFLA